MKDTDPITQYIEYESPRPRWKPVLGLIAVAVLLLFLFLSESDRLPTMNLKQIPKPNSTDLSQISVTTNPAYADKLNLYAEKKAALAKENGSSFITPISNARPERLTETRTREVPPAPARPPAPREIKERKPSERRQRIREIVAGIAVSPVPQQIVRGTWKPEKDPEDNERQSRMTDGQKKDGEIGLPAPGTLLIAVNRIALTSDAPGPALAEVISE